MIEADARLLGAVEHALDAGQRGDDAADFVNQRRFRHIDMRDLMIGSPRRLATARISSSSPPPSRRTRSSPAWRSARLMCTGVETGVMPYSDSTTTRAPSRAASAISSPATASISRRLPGDARIVRAQALQVVVEMRQIDERQRRRPRAPDVHAAASAIQREAAIEVAGPQKWNSGNGPSSRVSSSRSSTGLV